MLKLFAATCLSIAMLFGFYPNENRNENKNTNGTAHTGIVATCYGKTPCNACSNCSQCKHCNSGGTCGKCAKTEATYKSKAPASTGQCKAITKKGTRCKRAAESGGYCWQHG